MAERRMFSKKIVDADAFMDMPLSTQALYLHLALRADDDGFVGNPKKIMRMIGANEDDYKVLAAKRFILIFPSGICVIKHWLIHNYIQNDRYKETQYVDEKKDLRIKDNKSYSECIQNVSSSDTQVRLELGKDRVGKDINTNTATKNVAIGENLESNTEIQPKKVKKDPNTPITNWAQYLNLMDEHNGRHINIIAMYFREKGLWFETTGKVNSAITRHLRAAKQLSPFDDKEIMEAVAVAKKDYPDIWTIETLQKVLTR